MFLYEKYFATGKQYDLNYRNSKPLYKTFILPILILASAKSKRASSVPSSADYVCIPITVK